MPSTYNISCHICFHMTKCLYIPCHIPHQLTYFILLYIAIIYPTHIISCVQTYIFLLTSSNSTSKARVSFNLIYNKYTNLIFILFHLHMVYFFYYSVILFYFMIPKLKLQSQPIEVWFSVRTLNKKLADCLSLCATLVGYIHFVMELRIFKLKFIKNISKEK